jgi:cytochrome P450 family 4
MESYMENSFILRQFQAVFNYFSPVTIIVTTVVTVWIINYNWKRARLVRLIEKIPGPPALPFFGESQSTEMKVQSTLLDNLPQAMQSR